MWDIAPDESTVRRESRKLPPLADYPKPSELSYVQPSPTATETGRSIRSGTNLLKKKKKIKRTRLYDR